MGKVNTKILELLIRFTIILKNGALIIGIVLIGIGLILEFVPNESIKAHHIIASLCTTLGTTFLSVSLINFIYEQWRDELMDNKINQIPDTVSKNIESLINSIPAKVANELKIVEILNSVTEKMLSSIKHIPTNVANELHSCAPCKIYPPTQTEPKENELSEFRTDLITTMRESKNYYYSGVDMTIASRCINKLFENDSSTYIEKMLFIISDPNPKDGENQKIINRKKSDKIKLTDSIKTINLRCSRTRYKIDAVFYILPNRPPLHIHKTDGLCFWGVVDKTGQWECPTTYCYENNNYELLMFKTIEDLIKQTQQRVDDKLYPSHKFEIISWDGKEENSNTDNNTITYKDNQDNTEHTVNIEQFVENMKINPPKVKAGRNKKKH